MKEILTAWGRSLGCACVKCIVGMCTITIRNLLKQTHIYRIKIYHHTLAQSFSNFSMHMNLPGDRFKMQVLIQYGYIPTRGPGGVHTAAGWTTF